jgi:hypothetical protein
MDFIVWAYKHYLTFKKWYSTHLSVTRYMITVLGDQVPLYTKTAIPIYGFLAVHNHNGAIRYQFTPNYTVNPYQESVKHWIGLQVVIHGKQYTLNPDEYLVSSNKLFTNTFKYWLCKQLNVKPTEDMQVTVISNDLDIQQLDKAITL